MWCRSDSLYRSSLERMGPSTGCSSHAYLVSSLLSVTHRLALDLSIKTLEQIVYFSAYIVVTVDEEGKAGAEKRTLTENPRPARIRSSASTMTLWQHSRPARRRDQLDALDKSTAESLKRSSSTTRCYRRSEESSRWIGFLSELKFREMNMKFGHLFRAGTGAESIREIVMSIDYDRLVEDLGKERQQTAARGSRKS